MMNIEGNINGYIMEACRVERRIEFQIHLIHLTSKSLLGYFSYYLRTSNDLSVEKFDKCLLFVVFCAYFLYKLG